MFFFLQVNTFCIYRDTYIFFTIDAIFEKQTMSERARKNLYYECCIHHNIKKKLDYLAGTIL